MMTTLVLSGDDRFDTYTALCRHLSVYSATVMPSDAADDGSSLTLTWTPDLTAQQQARLSLMLSRARSETGLSSQAYQAIAAEVPILRAYYSASSPTNAQSVTAIKSVIAVLRAMLRAS